ncbi:Protein of unknown function [Amycolatopsis marina]|uniref:Enediyne biosynthesis protein n=1 Tax=Amycolatopsis marina TaxID=490629 RepID=A0A1I0ZI27_9PSEU|nr:DUF1702 family protein [Amycolatopsis marina]SFB25314.1 Protein of unknown function [Amycolatopsis marina]
MARILGTIRRLVLAPSMTSVTSESRGFPGSDSIAAAELDRIPQSVVCGFEWGIEAPELWEIERRLDMVEPELRGFAYEGAAMACSILDAMAIRGRQRTRELLVGPGKQHIFLTYIGIGFAMARLPRRLWKGILPDLAESPYHPTMSWLAVDGYGFDRAYFDTRRWVDAQFVPKPYPWEDAPAYFPRAVDQGIGRALWFIHGANAQEVAAAVTRFAGPRQADLWSGVGLAATFAGGCDSAGLAHLHSAAGEHWPEMALGAVFAAKARDYAEFVPQHTKNALRTLAGLSVRAAVDLADGTAPGSGVPGPVPAYESWRRRIRDGLAGSAERIAS